MTDEQYLLVSVGILAALLLGVLLRKTLGRLVRIVLRTAAGCGLLAVLAAFDGVLGLHLGVNLYNALVIGVLGAPGVGLLLMLSWMAR